MYWNRDPVWGMNTAYDKSGNQFLTRFDKISTQGTQMAADKEAISSSRVHTYYSKRNLAIFEVKPAFTRYLFILFLNILTLLARTQSVDNVFYTLMVLWENEHFLTSTLLCPSTSILLESIFS